MKMTFFRRVLLVSSAVWASIPLVKCSRERTLFDFSQLDNLNEWIESSDTVRVQGMSKATFVLQKTKQFQRAIFFALLNPQPNGAGFAGVNVPTQLNLQDYHNLQIQLRAQGTSRNFKIVLRHHQQVGDAFPAYEQTFCVPTSPDFTTISLPLADFKPYFRGKPLNESEVGSLDLTYVTSLGIQLYGGVYSPIKQSGPSTLEIDWIKATN